MAFTWTPDMPSVTSSPELEPHARAAIIAAATFLDAIPREATGDALPRWDQQATRATPRNAVAEAMAAAIEPVLALVPAAQRGAIGALAVRMAIAVRDGGGGDAGWQAMQRGLTVSRVVRRKIQAAAR